MGGKDRGRVSGKVAFITGGASGIGLGMARAFVNAGMKVVLADIRDDHIASALKLFAEAGQGDRVHALTLDVTDRAAYARAADEAVARFGKVHVLCNNAGMGLVGPLKQTKFDDWDWGISVMITGVVNGIQIFLPHLLSPRRGRPYRQHLVDVLHRADPGRVDLYPRQSALVGLSESIRGELAPDGIGVSAFLPGPVQTNISQSGRTRPEKFKQNSGFAEVEAQLAERPNSPLWMDPLECGERVLNGIRCNDLYIITHREFKEGTQERFDYILNSFPDEPVNQARADGIRFLLSNPIYSDKK